MSVKIHPLAYVAPGAKLGENVEIDPFVYIDEQVEIGDNCHVRAHASVLRGTVMGHDNVIYEGAVIGAEPQDFRWKRGTMTRLIIGNDNRIHEQVIINRSIHCEPDAATTIGSGSFIMAQSHVGHDCRVADRCVLGNAVKLAGDVSIGTCSILSSGVIVHENCDLGEWVLIKGGCRVNSNVPPFVIMAHNPITYFGVNAYILKRGNFNSAEINDIAKCYRHLFQSQTSVRNAVNRILADVEPSGRRDSVVEFIRNHHYEIAATVKLDEE